MWGVRGSVGASADLISTARAWDGRGWGMTEVSVLCRVLGSTTRAAGERVETVMEREGRGSGKDGN
jgi:hypothetical protein